MPAVRPRTVVPPLIGLLALGTAGLAASLPGDEHAHHPTPTATVIEATVVPPGAVPPHLDLSASVEPLPPGASDPLAGAVPTGGPVASPGVDDAVRPATHVAVGGGPVRDLVPDGAAQPEEPDEPQDPVYEADDGEQIDAERIESYLEGRGAPLAEQAETLVAAGVQHDVDPRLVVAIAVAESSGGERKPAGTYNAWGWSGTGPHGLHAWSSWEESIWDFTARLDELYDVDEVDADFAQTYVPPNWRWWLDTVRAVMAEM